MKLLVIVLCTLATVMAIGCSDEENEPTSPDENTDSFTAKVGDQEWVAATTLAYRAVLFGEEQVSATGELVNSSTGKTEQMSVSGITDVGTFTIPGGRVAIGYGKFFEGTATGSDGYISKQGEVIVTELTDSRIVGTFTATMWNTVTDDLIDITKGSFDMAILQ